MKRLVLACECTVLAVLCLTLVAQTVLAADNMIRPQCWEENVNGEVHRHCEVKRAAAPPPVTKDAPSSPVYHPQSPQPPAYYAPPYPGYQSTLAPRYWPGVPQQGRNWTNPCTPYICGYGSPYGYGYPPPYYVPLPLFAFGFGPFRFVIP